MQPQGKKKLGVKLCVCLWETPSTVNGVFILLTAVYLELEVLEAL